MIRTRKTKSSAGNGDDSMQDTIRPTEPVFTGARYLPGLKGNMQLEHLHRYALACEYVRGKIVLDIACGEGYGCRMLSETAAQVIGVDIDSEIIAYAEGKYRKENIRFQVGSCEQIPLDDASMDVVVSFETLEHLVQQNVMMEEFKRVLKPDGLLIISSPDKYEYSENTGYENPFHVKELYGDQFQDLISRYFRHFCFYGQRIAFGSGIFSGSDTRCTYFYDLKKIEQHAVQAGRLRGMARPIYHIAVASDQPLPAGAGSFLEEPVWESEAYRKGIEKIKNRLHTVETQALEMQRALGRQEQVISHCDQTVADWQNRWETAQERFKELEGMRTNRDQTLSEKEKQIVEQMLWIEQLHKQRAEAEKQSQALQELLDQKDGVITETRQALADLQTTLAAGRQNLEESQADLARQKTITTDLQQQILDHDNTMDDLMTQLIQEKQKSRENEMGMAEKDQQIHLYREELFSVYTSRSWRYMRIPRRIRTVVRRMAMLPHHPRPRAVIKQMYLSMPAFLRNSRPVESFRNWFKKKEGRP